MDVNTLLFDIKYANYCKKISNYSDMWEDLYQEFRINILTTKHNISTSNIDGYFYSVISIMWKKMTGHGDAKKEIASLLVNHSNYSEPITDYIDTIPDSRTEDIYPEVSKLIKSENKKVKKQAEIFNACINGYTMAELSRETGMNYRTVHDAVRETTQKIKTNMTKNEIKQRLLTEGVSASYSGKTKTIYTNKPVSKQLEKDIINAGFKVEKK